MKAYSFSTLPCAVLLLVGFVSDLPSHPDTPRTLLPFLLEAGRNDLVIDACPERLVLFGPRLEV
jgi:hypothetical protein